MGDHCDMRDFEATVRSAFGKLVRELLPAVACERGWPVSAPDGFERVLLDHALGAPWETALPGPGVGTVAPLDLMVAVEMGERLLEGSACVARMHRRSIAMRAAQAERSARDPDLPRASAAPSAPRGPRG